MSSTSKQQAISPEISKIDYGKLQIFQVILQGLISVVLVGIFEIILINTPDTSKFYTFLAGLRVISPFIAVAIVLIVTYLFRDKLLFGRKLRQINFFYEKQLAIIEKQMKLLKTERLECKEPQRLQQIITALGKWEIKKQEIIDTQIDKINELQEQIL